MSALVVFTCNQVLASDNNGNNIIYTDPVAMNGDDRLTGVIDVKYLINPDANGLVYQAEQSEDGVNWINWGNPDNVTTATVKLVPAIAVQPSVFVRYRFEFASSLGNLGAVSFGLKALMDHA